MLQAGSQCYSQHSMWMNKQTVVHTYNKILFSDAKEQTINSCNTIGES